MDQGGDDIKITYLRLHLRGSLPWARIDKLIESFTEAVGQDDVEKTRVLLMDAVNGFHPQCDVADLVFAKKRASEDTTVESNILEYKRNT